MYEEKMAVYEKINFLVILFLRGCKKVLFSGGSSPGRKGCKWLDDISKCLKQAAKDLSLKSLGS